MLRLWLVLYAVAFGLVVAFTHVPQSVVAFIADLFLGANLLLLAAIGYKLFNDSSRSERMSLTLYR